MKSLGPYRFDLSLAAGSTIWFAPNTVGSGRLVFGVPIMNVRGCLAVNRVEPAHDFLRYVFIYQLPQSVLPIFIVSGNPKSV